MKRLGSRASNDKGGNAETHRAVWFARFAPNSTTSGGNRPPSRLVTSQTHTCSSDLCGTSSCQPTYTAFVRLHVGLPHHHCVPGRLGIATHAP